MIIYSLGYQKYFFDILHIIVQIRSVPPFILTLDQSKKNKIMIYRNPLTNLFSIYDTIESSLEPESFPSTNIPVAWNLVSKVFEVCVFKIDFQGLELIIVMRLERYVLKGVVPLLDELYSPFPNVCTSLCWGSFWWNCCFTLLILFICIVAQYFIH